MDPGTGKLYRATAEAARTLGLVPVRRELTDEERAKGRIRFADPCGCGSGRKFKHCCFLRASSPTGVGLSGNKSEGAK